jgi:hypothetical protein
MRIMKYFELLASVVIIAASGCQTMPDGTKSWGIGPPKVQESKYAAPTKMAVIWAPAVLNQPGQVPTRGFGGRVYFYDGANNPVAVEGQLIVYAYDDTVPAAGGKTPERKFAFTPEQFTQHYSPTQLGAAYSIWLPWDAAGQPQMEISLVPVFTAASGQLVMGQPSHNLLPGPTTAPSETRITSGSVPLQYGPLNQGDQMPPRRDYAVQQVAFEQMVYQQAQQQQGVPGQTALTPPQGSLGVETMSITLPGSLADRLAQAPQQASPLDRLNQYRAATAGTAGPLFAQAAMMREQAIATRSAPGVSPPPSPRPAGYQPPTPPAPNAPVPPRAGGPLQSPPSPGGQPSGPGGWPQSFQSLPTQGPLSGGQIPAR